MNMQVCMQSFICCCRHLPYNWFAAHHDNLKTFCSCWNSAAGALLTAGRCRPLRRRVKLPTGSACPPRDPCCWWELPCSPCHSPGGPNTSLSQVSGPDSNVAKRAADT